MWEDPQKIFYLGLGPTVRTPVLSFFKKYYLKKFWTEIIHLRWKERELDLSKRSRQTLEKHLHCLNHTDPQPEPKASSDLRRIDMNSIAILPYCHIAILLIKQPNTKTSGYWIAPQKENCPERAWQKLCSLTSPAVTKTNNIIKKIPTGACINYQIRSDLGRKFHFHCHSLWIDPFHSG